MGTHFDWKVFEAHQDGHCTTDDSRRLLSALELFELEREPLAHRLQPDWLEKKAISNTTF